MFFDWFVCDIEKSIYGSFFFEYLKAYTRSILLARFVSDPNAVNLAIRIEVLADHLGNIFPCLNYISKSLKKTLR